MKFEAATIKDIARALGVSTSTVSRALRDSYEISETTKQLVVDYAKNVNYKPNPVAVSLKTRKSKSIGVIVPEIANSFFSEVINGIECAANYYGYNVVITQSFESYKNEVDNMEFLASGSIDGCLVSVSTETTNFSHFTDIQERDFPIVYFDRIVEQLKGHKVITNNEKGCYEATMHLLENNYRKIAFLANEPTLYNTAKRFDGYKKALNAFNITVDDCIVKYCAHDGMHNEAESVLNELFEGDNKPDAIFASSDKLIIACLRYCKKHQIKIPDEIGLTGFSNLSINDLLCPSLTVVKQSALQMGKLATQLLIQTIEAKRPVAYEMQTLPVELKIGDSTRAKL